MNIKEYSIILIAVLTIILCISTVHAGIFVFTEDNGDSGDDITSVNKTIENKEFKLKANSPEKIKDKVLEIEKKDSYFTDSESQGTVKWLNGLKEYVIYSTYDGNYLVVNKSEANLPEEENTYNIVKCDVLENHTAGSAKYFLVKNLELIKQEQIVVQNTVQETTYDTSSSSTDSSDGVSYIGNANTGKFHRVGCSSVDRMSEGNKVFLSSREAAISSGFVPCQRCNP